MGHRTCRPSSQSHVSNVDKRILSRGTAPPAWIGPTPWLGLNIRRKPSTWISRISPAPWRRCALAERQIAESIEALTTRDSERAWRVDRKSTRLNSSHANISYAVFCLKKKKYN